MHGWKQIFVSILLGFSSLLLLSCGGGGGGDGGAPPAAQTTTVSGSVQAPGGQVAFNDPQGILQKFTDSIFPSAYALVTGLSPVPEGTMVQLIRLNATGTSFTGLASTTTSGGRYSFNLTNLGLQPSSDLAVLVANGAIQMRAFVTGADVAVDPVSEAAVRLVLERIAIPPGTTITQFTVLELSDISAAVSQLATQQQIAAGVNIESTVIAIKNAVSAHAGLDAFIAAAAGSGQTTTGPGDIGNYFPLVDGTTWSFQGTHSETGMPTTNFSNSLIVQGTKPVGAVTTTVVVETNHLNSGSAEENYYVKDSRGVLTYGTNDVEDKLTPNLIPYREIFFPLNVGLNSEVVNRKGVDFGEDLDHDGKNETVDVLYQVMVERFEDVTVPKGTFSNAAKVIQKANATLFPSTGQGSVTVVGTQTIWFAPGIGPVKRQMVIQDSGGQSVETSTEELVDVLISRHVSLATNDITYDPNTQRIYASIPGNPGSIRSINPVTGTVGPPILVGNEPMKLARSDNGQYLYVGLDGEGAVQRVDLTNQTAGLKFSLGSDSFFGPYYVEDMEVLPGSAQAVAISRQYKGVTPKHAGVAIYDNGVQRLNATPGHTGSNVIEFSNSPATLYGHNYETTEFGFRRMAVDSSGVTVLDATPDLVGDTFDIKFNAGFVYGSNGRVINPTTRTVVGTFSVIPGSNLNPTLVRPDSSIGRVFFYVRPNDPAQTGPARLLAFDQNTFQLLGSLDVENISGMSSSLIRWGTDGLAFRTSDSQVIIIQSKKLIP